MAKRDRKSGRYSYDGDFSRVCRCGHTLGIHAAEAPHPCFNEDDGIGDGAPCACERFRPAAARAS